MRAPSVQIVTFTAEHAAAFKALNEAWIAKQFAMERRHREVLDDPQGKIIAGGGQIFMALREGEAVGCVALIAMSDGGYEVAKMTVLEALRGGGVGKLLMQACIDAGRALGAPRLYLQTNSALAPAISLYRTMGFRHLEQGPSDYAFADVFMERALR